MTLILNRRTLIRLQRYNDGKIFSKYDCGLLYGNCKNKDIIRYDINAFAALGHLYFIKYHIAKRSIINYGEYSMVCAASYGHINIVKWLRRHLYLCCSNFAMNMASKNGYIDIVRFLHKNRQLKCHEVQNDNAMNYAAENGHLNIVKFFHDINITQQYPINCTIDAMDYASFNGHFDVVRFLHTHRTEGCSKFALSWAKMKGHDNIVKFLQHNYPQFA